MAPHILLAMLCLAVAEEPRQRLAPRRRAASADDHCLEICAFASGGATCLEALPFQDEGCPSDAHIVDIGKECGLLRDLELRAAFGVDVAAGKALAAGCPNLRRVAVRGGPTVDNYALEPLLRRCLRLEALALADCSAVDDELLLDVADVAADLPLALADLSLHRTSCTRAGVDALRDALAKDEHNTALRIDFDGPPADDAPPPVESPLT